MRRMANHDILTAKYSRSARVRDKSLLILWERNHRSRRAIVVSSSITMTSFDDEGVVTETSVVQQDTENDCLRLLFSPPFEAEGVPVRQLGGVPGAPPNPRLGAVFVREKHIDYLRRSLQRLSRHMKALDASRPWLVYWIVHSLGMLHALPLDMVGLTVRSACFRLRQ